MSAFFFTFSRDIKKMSANADISLILRTSLKKVKKTRTCPRWCLPTMTSRKLEDELEDELEDSTLSIFLQSSNFNKRS